MLRIKKATDALTDVGRKAINATGTKKPLVGDARGDLGGTIKTPPGDAGETIVTPGDAEEPPTTATRSSMKGSLIGHSSSARET